MGFRDFLAAYKWTILLVTLGLVFVVLIFTINFWRTLLVFAILGVCVFFGILLDRGGREGVRDFFRKIFGGR